MRIIDNIPVWGKEVDEGALAQIRACYGAGFQVALMADHHKGYSVPIGGVLAHPYLIAPQGVGFDLACGVKGIETDADATDVRENIARIMDDIWRSVSFGVGRKNAESVDATLFYDDTAWEIEHRGSSWKLASLRDMARAQLGTVGSGNHYVDILEDSKGRIWITAHFGSRGLGHKIATHFFERLDCKDAMDAPIKTLDTRTDEGQGYLAAMHLAGRYAYAGRDWVCNKVLSILGAHAVSEVHNHHNFAWRERQGSEDMWVVRKGATPAFPGQRGVIGGTMSTLSAIVEGAEEEGPEQPLAMYSTVHGAGRVMGRMEAKGKRDKLTGAWKREPRVTQAMMDEAVQAAHVELRGGGVDEAQACYKRLEDVLDEHQESIKILTTMRPLGVAMASRFEKDPYKD